MIKSAVMEQLGIGWGLLIFFISVGIAAVAFGFACFLNGPRKKWYVCIRFSAVFGRTDELMIISLTGHFVM